MIKSMTGYGKAEHEADGKHFIMEIKSLNSKNFDLSVKAPSVYKENETEWRNIISEKLQRGKIDLTLSIDQCSSQGSYSINGEIIKKYFEELSQLSSNIGIEQINKEEFLGVLLQLPESFSLKASTTNDNERDIMTALLTEAAGLLDEHRLQEGKSIENDLKIHVNRIQMLLESIDAFENERQKTIRNKLKGELAKLKEESLQADEHRFEQEILYYLEKMDFSEEKSRIKNHLDYFKTTMSGPKSSGKKLSFIIQELGREINTLGSKAHHFEIQKTVVEMKDDLEKMKEQIMNVL